MEKKLICNRIKTPDGTILISYHVHDYNIYIDKNGLEYMVDGGNQYLRRNTHENAPYEELSVYSDVPFKEIREVYCRGGRGIGGKEPLKWVPLCDMSIDWLKNCIKYNEERGFSESFANQMYKKELEYKNNL